MSNWTPITLADLEDSKLAPLVDALRTAALADSQSDPAPRLVQKVVDLVRGKIKSNPKNVLDSDVTTVPKSLVSLTVDLVIFELKDRLEQELTEYELRVFSRHNATLDRVADGKDKVDAPDDAVEADVADASGVEVLSSNPPRTTRQRMNGL